MVEIPRAAPAVQIPVVVPRDLTTDELIYRVLADRTTACLLIGVLTRQADDGTLDPQVRNECYQLARVLLPRSGSFQDRSRGAVPGPDLDR